MLKLIFVIDGLGTSREIALRWLSLKVTEDKSTLVQVKAWCRQAKALLEPTLTQIYVAIWLH